MTLKISLWQVWLTWLSAVKLSLTFSLQRLFATVVLVLLLLWEVFPRGAHQLLSRSSEHNTQISNIYIYPYISHVPKRSSEKTSDAKILMKKYLNRNFENIKNVTDNSLSEVFSSFSDSTCMFCSASSLWTLENNYRKQLWNIYSWEISRKSDYISLQFCPYQLNKNLQEGCEHIWGYLNRIWINAKNTLKDH